MSVHGNKPAPPDRRPYRRMSAPGREQICYVADSSGRVFSQVLRQVGWQGQSGAFYALHEGVNPTDHEPGSFTPLFVEAHSDEITAAELVDRLTKDA